MHWIETKSFGWMWLVGVCWGWEPWNILWSDIVIIWGQTQVSHVTTVNTNDHCHNVSHCIHYASHFPVIFQETGAPRAPDDFWICSFDNNFIPLHFPNKRLDSSSYIGSSLISESKMQIRFGKTIESKVMWLLGHHLLSSCNSKMFTLFTSRFVVYSRLWYLMPQRLITERAWQIWWYHGSNNLPSWFQTSNVWRRQKICSSHQFGIDHTVNSQHPDREASQKPDKEHQSITNQFGTKYMAQIQAAVENIKPVKTARLKWSNGLWL